MSELQSQQLEQTLNHIHELIAQYHEEEPHNDTAPATPRTQELAHYLNTLHGADIADLLEFLSLEDRLLLWSLLPSEAAAYVLIEITPTLRPALIDALTRQELIDIVNHLDSEELVDITPHIEDTVLNEILTTLDEQERQEFDQARLFDDTQVGSLMDFDQIKVRNDVTCSVILRYLRRFDTLPPKTDQIFIVDDSDHLVGTIALRTLIVNDPSTPVIDVMNTDIHTFTPDEDVEDAANAFERYDLTTAAVVDENRRLIGRLTIGEMVDVLRAVHEEDMFNMAGFSSVQNIFSPVIDAFKSRWMWLVINLITAFAASRIIGLFEGSIEKIVALASLMPIVAGLGGNAGNQTITMIVRAMAQKTFTWAQIKTMLLNEFLIAILNGIVWGGVLGLITWWLYDFAKLGFVMMLAMTLNLVLAAAMGVLIPYIMQRIGRDPALGSSVLITACTDSGGFFIFLGLANILLL